MNGFVNVLKPVGATASDVVVCLKHLLREKKVGHLGTLDPGASGVLPVAIGQATKLFNYLTDKVKYYRAFFTFGVTTDTLDSYGVKSSITGLVPTKEQLISVLNAFRGELEQVPPIYSAKSVGGVRAYKLARNGVDVELKSRKVIIHDIELITQKNESTFVFDIRCSAGTYIRSMARDIAAACGTVGYMSGLIRLQSGCFNIVDAYTLDEIRVLKESCALDISYPLRDVEECVFPNECYNDIDFGRKIHCPFNDGYRKIICKNTFFGLGKNDNGYLRIEYYLKNVNYE